MYQQWRRLVFMHWRYPPGVVQPVLPAGRLAAAQAEHPRWPLHHAELHALDQDLLQAAGLPAPGTGPLLHASPGVSVRIGLRHR